MKEPKFKTTFSSFVKVVVPTEKDRHLALASIKNLSHVFPDVAFLESNPDLLFIAGNVAVADFINLNDDGILGSTALKIAKKFVHKFVDIEHDRTRIVGALASYGFSEYGSNVFLSEEDASNSGEPFNIAVGGFIWTIANPGLAELIVECSDENSPKYGDISFSWEVGFDEYVIALGSKNLKEAQIITDPVEIEKYSKYLRAENGPGKTEEGVPVYRVISGEPIPLGCGLVSQPAAPVKGVLALIDYPSIESQPAIASEEGNLDNPTENIENSEKTSENEEKIENNNEKSVNKNSTMKLKKIDDITDESLKEISASAVHSFIGEHIAQEIDKVSTKYSKELEAKEAEVKAQEEAAAKLKEDLESAKAEFERITKELEQEREARAAEKSQADFNSRMSELTTEYDLSEADCKIVAKRIAGMDEESYAEWLEEFSVLASAKKKTESTASVNTDTEAVLDNATPNGGDVPNTTKTETTIFDKFAEAFKLDDVLAK